MPLYERVIRRRGSGDYQKGRAGENLGRGQVVYKNPNGAWYRADADAVATMPVIGITLDSAIAGQVVRILTEGYIGAGTWAWTTGSEIYASTVTGALTQTAPIAPDIAQPIAMAVSPTMILFDPHLDSSAYENRHITEPDAEVYSTDGGTTFTYRRDNAGVWEEPGVTYVDPALAIEAAWLWLAGQGGGTFRTRGPGETWTTATTIDSQGANVTWLSDWGLTIELGAGVDAYTIYVSHNNVQLHGLSVDGNESNQVAPGNNVDAVRLEDASDFVMENCKIVEGWSAGFRAWGTGSGIKVLNSYFSGNQANGITINTGFSIVDIAGNTVLESSDVGISCYGSYANIHDNIVHHIDNSESPYGVNSHVGIALEGTAAGGASYINIGNNTIYNCTGPGIYVATNEADGGNVVEITNNIIYNVGRGMNITKWNDILIADNEIYTTTWHGIHIHSAATDVVIKDNLLGSIGDANTDIGIFIDSIDSTTIDGNRLKTISGAGIQVQGSDDCEVIDNRLEDINGGRRGIYILGCLRIKISDNTVIDSESYGISVTTTSTDAQITNNKLYNIGANGIYLDAAINALIEGNKIITVTGYCIQFNQNVDDARVCGNYTSGGTVGDVIISNANCNNNDFSGGNSFMGTTFTDGGTDTILPTLVFDFTHYGGGSAGWTSPIITTSPGAIDIDAVGEFAFCHVTLPAEVRQVLRISFWAYSNTAWAATNVLNMLLRVVVNAGTSTEAWNTHVIDVANHPSEEDGSEGVAQFDVIHWIVDRGDDQDIDSFVGGDFLEIIAVGNGAVAPDLATDALFGGVEIEYV